MAYKVIGGVVELNDGTKVQGNDIAGSALSGKSVFKGNGNIVIENQDTGASVSYSYGQTIILP